MFLTSETTGSLGGDASGGGVVGEQVGAGGAVWGRDVSGLNPNRIRGFGMQQSLIAASQTLDCQSAWWGAARVETPTLNQMKAKQGGHCGQVHDFHRRARVLTEEYAKKASDVDRVYGGVAEGTVGRVQRKLVDFGEVRGLVFGAFGECSEGVHELVHHLANSRLKAEGLQQGRESGKGELGVLVGQVRRILSITAVRAQAECLLSRLRHVGRGTGAAYSRRQGAVREEVNWARERQAKAAGRRQGKKVVKRGMFLLN